MLYIKRRADRFLTLYVPLILFMAFILLPLYWTLVTALKREGDILKRPLAYWPSPLTFENFAFAWENVGFSTYFQNSMLVAGVTVVFVLIISIFTGYAISRFSFRGKSGFMLLLLCTQFVPAAMLLIPLFIMMKNAGLTGNYFSLILTYTTLQLPFNSILMSSFIANVPEQLEEAAMVDGCTRFQSVLYVVMPVLVPGIVATASFTFIYAWNEFLFGLMFISKHTMFTIPVGLNSMLGEYNINYGALAAGSMIALLPAVLLFMYIQKFLVQGIGDGAVKG